MRPVSTIVTLLVAAASAFGTAQAAESEHAALQLIVPVAPGGSSDRVARTLAVPLGKALDRVVRVENRPGATGRIAVDALRRAAPGSALLVAPAAVFVTAPLLSRDPAQWPRDLVPVARLTTFDYGLAVRSDHVARSFAEFVTWARDASAPVPFAGTGVGALPHLTGLAIARAAGFATRFVPYADIGRLESDLLGGHVASAVAASSDLLALHQAGRIRILAVTGGARAPDLPGVPTFRELGYPAVQVMGWNGLFAGPGTPAVEAARIARSVESILGDPAIAAALRASGLHVAPTSPDAFAALITRDTAFWTPIIRESGLTGLLP